MWLWLRNQALMGWQNEKYNNKVEILTKDKSKLSMKRCGSHAHYTRKYMLYTYKKLRW